MTANQNNPALCPLQIQAQTRDLLPNSAPFVGMGQWR